jgi:Iron dependent repressor, metal binding and dimerisation domain
MEHVTPDMVADRLASFLGDPKTGPTGKPIPGGSATNPTETQLLAIVAVGDTVTVESTGTDHAMFLQSQGIDEGVEITVLGLGVDGSVLLQGPIGTLHLEESITNQISVSPS